MSQVRMQSHVHVKSEIVETLLASDIVASWQSDFGIDVSHLFEGVEQVYLLKDLETGHLSFEPPIAGDDAFYQALRAFDWYHPASKEEYVAAARWLRPGERVIDVGAGHGRFAAHIHRRMYLGLETDPAAAAYCAAHGLNVLNLDMAALRQVEGVRTAGLVTAFQVLEHVKDPDQFLKEMISLTCPGGRVAIGVPDAASYVSDLPDFMLNAPPHHLTWWTEESLRSLMERSGLTVQASYRFPVEPWERQLWWMARLAKLQAKVDENRFGQRLKGRKLAAYIGSLIMRVLPLPRDAQGATLLMIAEKTL